MWEVFLCCVKKVLFFMILCNISVAEVLLDGDTNNEEIQQYFNTNECDKIDTKVCQTIKDFLFSLQTLEKIQLNNLILAYNNETTRSARSKSDVKYSKSELKELKDGGKQKLDYHDIQSKEIVMVTKEEYIELRNSMVRFCNNFKDLNKQEKKLLFTLKWHNQFLFKDENFIKKFCASKF